MTRKLALIALPLLLLGACKGGTRDQGAGKAEGEILAGSASDAMLPVDTVRSQAPLAPHSDPAARARDQDPAAAASDSTTAAQGDAVPDAPTPPADEGAD